MWMMDLPKFAPSALVLCTVNGKAMLRGETYCTEAEYYFH
jgi:hypothetical protein